MPIDLPVAVASFALRSPLAMAQLQQAMDRQQTGTYDGPSGPQVCRLFTGADGEAYLTDSLVILATPLRSSSLGHLVETPTPTTTTTMTGPLYLPQVMREVITRDFSELSGQDKEALKNVGSFLVVDSVIEKR